jgi:hypothetical protein
VVECAVLVVGRSAPNAYWTLKDRREELRTAIGVFEWQAAAARRIINISTPHQTLPKASKERTQLSTAWDYDEDLSHLGGVHTKIIRSKFPSFQVIELIDS